LFPFFSILVASFIASFSSKGEKTFYSFTQLFYSAVFVTGAIVINFFLKPDHQWIYFAGSLLLISSILIVFLKSTSSNLKWLIISCLSVLYINFYLNLTLYPKMSSLKGEIQAAAFVNQFYPDRRLGIFQNRRNGFEFYARQPVLQIDMNEWISGAGQDRIFYLDDVNYPQLISRNAHFKILQQFNDHSSENIIKFVSSTAKEYNQHQGYLIQAIK